MSLRLIANQSIFLDPQQRRRGWSTAKMEGPWLLLAVFSFLYLKKIKISKIYVRFGKFQKYTPVAPHRTRL